MRRPGAVRFNAALRASHDARGLRDVQFLPVTHQESFALTRRQLPQLLLNDFKDLSLLEAAPGRRLDVGAVGPLVAVERILWLFVIAPPRRQGGKERGPQG